MTRVFLGVFKIVLMGDGAVGKTSLIKGYLGKGFSTDYIQTLGVDFYIAKEKLQTKSGDIVSVTWQVWDLAGQPKWSQVRARFYRGARGGLLVFDVSRRETFENIPQWANEFVKNAPGAHPLVLVGNKIDLRKDAPNCISTEEGEKMAKMLSEALGIEIPYIETSALMGVNVREAFHKLFHNIVEKYL
ncbi:MAG: Rab family GTPase [Candidatus Njordarchaeales archaeon]